MGHTKSVTERLVQARKYMPYKRVMALVMQGLECNRTDIAEATGIGEEELTTFRQGHAATLKAIRANPNEARALVLQWQRDMAMVRGFALSHATSTPPRELRNIVSTAAILAKSALPAPSAKASAAKAPAAPARPA